jgi:hypothetical protein
MSNQDFDEFIKGKLKDLTEQKSGSDWYAFSELLKKEEAFADFDIKNELQGDSELNKSKVLETEKNKDFDSQVSEKINAHETIYRETHWEALRARLEREEYLRKNLYRTKLIEIAAILFLFFSFSSMHDVEFDMTSKADQSMFAHLYQKMKSNIDIDERLTTVVAKISDAITKISPSNYTIKESSYTIPIKRNYIIPQLLSLNLHTSVEPLDLIANASNLKSDKIIFTASKDMVSKLNKIETSLQSIAHDHPKLFLSEKIAQIKDAASTKFELGAYVSQGIVEVNSEYDNVYNMQGPSIITHNTKFGFTFAAGTDNLKFFAGIEKSKRTYAPTFVNESYGSADTGYKSISLTSIQQSAVRIPLGLKYTPFISHNHKHKISALINVGSNIITTANYDITNVRLAPSVRPDQTLSSSRSSREEPLLFLKPFERGALNEGLLLDNFYLDAGLDVAYERRLTNKIDLSAGLSYVKYLGGSRIGPNKDGYNQYHIKLGINYTL